MNIMGLELTQEQADELSYWLSNPAGEPFWTLIREFRDGCHLRASKPAGATHKTGMGTNQLIPLAILDAQARENLAKENAYDIVLNTRHEAKEEYMKNAEKLDKRKKKT